MRRDDVSEPIRPALTSTEWAEGRYGYDGEQEADGEDAYSAWLKPDGEVGIAANLVGVDGPSAHALAALCLHGQPFGVRHEMADAIARAADGKPLSDNDIAWMRTAVHVILSLLPPRSADEDMPAVQGDEE